MTSDSRQILSVCAGYAAAGAFWGAFAAAMPAIRAASGLDPRGFGALLLALSGGAFPAMFLLSRYLHRLRRLAMPGSLALFAVGAAVLAASEGGASLGVALALLGAGSGALDVAMNTRLSQLERATGRSLFNLAHATFPLALLLASVATGALRDAGVDPGNLFGALALALLAVGLAEYRCAEHAPASPADAEAGPGPRVVGPALLLLGLTAALAAFAEMSAQSWSAIYVESVLGASATGAGVAYAAFTAGLGLGRLGAHALDGRLPARTLVAGVAGLGVAAFAGLGAGSGLAAASACLLAAGVAVGPIEPSVFRAVSRRHAERAHGPALGLVTSIAYVGYLVSPPILGALAEAAGWRAMWWGVAAAFGAVALVFRAVPSEP